MTKRQVINKLVSCGIKEGDLVVGEGIFKDKRIAIGWKWENIWKSSAANRYFIASNSTFMTKNTYLYKKGKWTFESKKK